MATIPRKRRKARLEERLIPCQCCAYPVSQRHHVLPVARFGEYGGDTIHLCANCHEAYHIFERGMIDIAAQRQSTHALRLMGAIWRAWGGEQDRRVQYINRLLEFAQEQQEETARQPDPPEDDDIAQRLRDALDESKPRPPGVRRGDTVRLENGKIVQVVRVRGFEAQTTDGTYSLLDIEKIAQWS